MAIQETIGIILNLLGSVSINFGTNLLKYSHIKAEQTKKNASGSGSPLWYTGFAIFSIGNLLNFSSFTFASSSLLSGLGSIQFVTNVIFNKYMLSIPISRRALAATAMIISGQVFVILFGSDVANNYTANELMRLFIDTQFVIYIICLASYGGVAFAAYRILTAIERETPFYKRFLTHYSSPNWSETVTSSLFANLSAMIGTFSVVLAKCVAELILMTIAGESQFDDPMTYVFLAAWLALIMFWLNRMNVALVRFDGQFIIPVLQINWIMFSILNGGMYFKEFDTFTVTQTVLFSVGVGLILAGVVFLSPKTEEKDTEETEEKKAVKIGLGVVEKQLSDGALRRASQAMRRDTFFSGLVVPMDDMIGE